ncbi:MAG: ATP-dependent 6-phosphofructokinase [Ignavibacteriaceae bacterium]|jgi:6-phosphofructokinase|nr:MAG: 6-phosphofructokinase [Chlorobiota bacterium]KXK06267.1 MAG: phosphofructokinase [Chlorobi bacterium OLB4]MBV6399221.1 Pyrophosphate--fructose 6-phosphate 1-phosphotransferase [Ignavibacteria bacterium]MCC6884894.1 6-phosphofructokinase [Ignavibacteriales bacterium]MCE7953575.1 6-phosphofructokinase [Chlorobi bacterium CHB7]MDL1887535.1 6-phosphofructokinase [Ignavibacteria bacterium CHB1]MEB2329337.1 ATP-dependent 6-phosphofructokinase [Ignavibacteriaceae bacterium]OQY78420.1 MAG: 6
MNLAVLTSGGDCPGLNAVIRAIVRSALPDKIKVTGIIGGWEGIWKGEYVDLNMPAVAGIINRGGTILGTSRFSPFEQKNGKKILLERLSHKNFDAIIAIGGEGSMHIAQLAHEAGVNIIGVPKTIDNDINGTDYTFGFDTAVSIATEAIDRLHTTAESHHRIMVLEVMGRHAGWIALYSGIAGGADVVIIPEFETQLDNITGVIQKRYDRGKLFSIIVIAEGAEFIEKEIKDSRKYIKKKDDFGRTRLGGIGYLLAEEIEQRTGFESRATILGYVQRGGMPSAFDRILGTRFGVHAVKMFLNRQFGRMAAIRSNIITDISIKEAISKLKTVDKETYEVAKVFFG